MEEPRVGPKLESVIVVYDKNGKYFQTWWNNHKRDAIEHGIKIAEKIGGYYVIINDE
jgi:hypothetical protein